MNDPRLDSRRIIASVSGGKDSAAMCLHLRELGIPYDAVFMDTGWEHPATYDYLRGPLTGALGPIRWLRAEVDLDPEREARWEEASAMLRPRRMFYVAPPGGMDGGMVSEVGDDDTLCCACSVAESRAGRCHRAWAAPFLHAAGWRVVLDGREWAPIPAAAP